MSRGPAMRKELYTARRAVGMICPPPRKMGSAASSAPVTRNLVLRMGSSQRGPSRVPHEKPCLMLSCTDFNSFLSVVEGKVSSHKMLGPISSGPNAQIDRAASLSHSYF